MTNQEMVDILREKAKVSGDEARAALELSDWDLLEAMLLLEKQGKVRQTTAAYSTRTEPEPDPEGEDDHHKGFHEGMRWLARAVRKLIRIGYANSLAVLRHEKEIFRMPVIIWAILLILCTWPMIIITVGSLFFDVRYAFYGPQLGKEGINDAMNRAADVAGNVREDFRSATGNKN